jgi:hypothetical protein
MEVSNADRDEVALVLAARTRRSGRLRDARADVAEDGNDRAPRRGRDRYRHAAGLRRAIVRTDRVLDDPEPGADRVRGRGRNGVVCQRQITNPDNFMEGAYELPKFPVVDAELGLSNGFFAASQYQTDCSAPIFFVNQPPSRLDCAMSKWTTK